MTVELVRVCMFCLLCATHSHCSSHDDVDNSHLTDGGLKGSYNDGGGGHINEVLQPPSQSQHLPSHRSERSEEPVNPVDRDYINLLLRKFGDGNTLSRQGLEQLLVAHNLHLTVQENVDQKYNMSKNGTSRNTGCLTVDKFLGDSNQLTHEELREMCPKLLYHKAVGDACSDKPRITDLPQDNQPDESSALVGTKTILVWVYATVSVVLISLCGLLAVAVIPLMQRSIYQSLLQFLVALAVGTLCGDALLHLLPHAMLSSHGAHDHSLFSLHQDRDQHDVNLWRGFVAAIAVLFFYFTEKCLSIVTDWRKRNQRKHKKSCTVCCISCLPSIKKHLQSDPVPQTDHILNLQHGVSPSSMMNTRVRVMREESHVDEEGRVGEKLCKHKYSSYPYCYGEIANSAGENAPRIVPGDGEIHSISQIRDENGTAKHDEGGDLHKEDLPSSDKQLLDGSGDRLPEYTVILREHETRHHGHAHAHGHVHSAPGSLSSVAWMVVMGDGLHNLADGLAIGTAFAANIGGGFSTAVAVFCHELPHEIGDFAVLLKAGMSAKQAVFYNLLSSILCFLGMSLGVVLGHNENIKPWVFSFASGMFLYIALVDMVPELSSSHSREGGSLCQCVVQLCGLLSGVGIMLIIALYEHTLMESLQHSF